VARLLAEARAALTDALTGPARPWQVEDFRRYLVILTADRHIHLVRRVAEEAAERQEQADAARRRADEIGGSVLAVAALDAQSAREVAYADGLTRAWNTRAWQATHE
jgi:hypothetical protein